MRFYKRLDFQLAFLFLVMISLIITLTGLLNQVSVEIWLYKQNPELQKQLDNNRSYFNQLSLLKNEQELTNRALNIFRNEGFSKQKYIYIITDSYLNTLVDSSSEHTQIELIRSEPRGENYSVLTSSNYNKHESFLIFSQVPAIVVIRDRHLRKSRNPIDLRHPNRASLRV